MPSFFDKLRRRAPANSQQTQTEAPQAQNADANTNANSLSTMLDGGQINYEDQIKRMVEQSAPTKMILARYSGGATPEQTRQSIEFEIFCHGEYVIENLNFVRDVYSMVANDDQQFASHLKFLLVHYVAQNAPQSINVAFALRGELAHILEQALPDRDAVMRLLAEAVRECLSLLQASVNRFKRAQEERASNPGKAKENDVLTRLRRDDRISRAKSNRRVRVKHLWSDLDAKRHAGDSEKKARSFDEYVNKVQAPSKLLNRPSYQITQKWRRGYDERTMNDWLRLTSRAVYQPVRPITVEPTEEEE
ncbi:MAG: hypothetical protein U0787_03915 [Polyangia bacterium]|jgi:hypothetical protein